MRSIVRVIFGVFLPVFYLVGCASPSDYLAKGFDMKYQPVADNMSCEFAFGTPSNPNFGKKVDIYTNCSSRSLSGYPVLIGWTRMTDQKRLHLHFFARETLFRKSKSPELTYMPESLIHCSKIAANAKGELVRCFGVPFKNGEEDVPLTLFAFHFKSRQMNDTFIVVHSDFKDEAGAKSTILEYVSRMEISSD